MESPRPTTPDGPPPHGDPLSGPDGEGFNAGYGPPPPPPPRPQLDFSALFVLIDLLRRAAPAELQAQLTSLIREALLTLRSLIDLYLDRLERKPAEPRVEDIPID